MNKRNQGFTLLEILLVIAAIGILASIVIVAINPLKQIGKTRNAARYSNINTIQKALDQYYIANGRYPEGILTEYQEICVDGDITECVDLNELVPTYIAEIPRDPEGGGYKIAINLENNKISVWADKSGLGEFISINSTPTALIYEKISNGEISATPTQQLIDNHLVYTNHEQTEIFVDKYNPNINCPEGYIPVPGNTMYGTDDFCIMKYEAKALEISTGSIVSDFQINTGDTNTYRSVSVPEGMPWRRINQINARTHCENVGGSLINLSQRQTISRNIEAVDSNWSNGEVGNGSINRGHTNNFPSNPLQASVNDENGCFGYTNGRICDNGDWHINKRTHTLSNGEIVWDFSGNISNWLDNTIPRGSKPNSNSGSFLQEWTDFNDTNSDYGILSYDLVRPSNIFWNSSQGIGKYQKDPTILHYNFPEDGLVFGGSWWREDSAGIFNMWATLDVFVDNNNTLGFRCTSDPIN